MKKEAYAELIRTQKTHWWFCGKRAIVQYFFKKYNTLKNPRILDLGCGTGALLEMLEKDGQVSGLEYEKSAVEYCNKNFGDKVKQGSLPDDIPFHENGFDVLVSCDVLEHVEDDKKSIKKIYNLLSDEGIAIITVPALKCLWSYNDEFVQHKRRYEKADLIEKMEEAGFKIKRCTYYNTLLFLPILIIRKIKNILNINKPDLSETPDMGIINSILKFIFLSEVKLLKKINLPIGVSLLIIVSKNN
ncbi:class I SAM-dependent methyltransferase [Clostridium sp. BJN0001]|uniref:class I SAM-dependent methyltransferase n=1 Tax=Clostridium sp. BJN0001 TaxID=2930219 RepID=UPI001FD2D3B1|nr:class I SAM-dependent methyltransferase [Clostridium sp. BJN0001]